MILGGLFCLIVWVLVCNVVFPGWVILVDVLRVITCDALWAGCYYDWFCCLSYRCLVLIFIYLNCFFLVFLFDVVFI